MPLAFPVSYELKQRALPADEMAINIGFLSIMAGKIKSIGVESRRH